MGWQPDLFWPAVPRSHERLKVCGGAVRPPLFATCEGENHGSSRRKYRQCSRSSGQRWYSMDQSCHPRPDWCLCRSPDRNQVCSGNQLYRLPEQPCIQEQHPWSRQHCRQSRLRSPTGRCRTTTTTRWVRQRTAHSGFVRQAPSQQVRTCTVTAGAATAGAGTFECNVVGGVVVGDFFWANVVAES